jgi:hypothetical protein
MTLKFLVGTSLLILGANAFAPSSNSLLPNRCSLSLGAQKRLARDNEPGSELFRYQESYVPSGLSSDQYQKIKQEEAAKLKRMNFGAWGPRFKQTDRPDGDWMVMPRLWTSGFNSNNDPSRVPLVGEPVGQRLSPRLGDFVKENGAGFVLAYVLIHSFLAAISLWRSKEVSLQKFFLSAITNGNVVPRFTVQLRIAALSLATLLTPISKNILDKVNRTKLWAPRRTVSLAGGFTIGMLSIWAIILRYIGTRGLL